MTNTMTTAIILAGGSGTRMGGEVTKQKIELLGISVLRRSVMAFDACPLVDNIIVVAREDEVDYVKKELSSIRKPLKVVVGGKTRNESALCGFSAVAADCNFVAIHDAARCLISCEDIEKVIKTAWLTGAASLVAKMVDTVKAIDKDGMIVSTIPRDTLVRAQTPQVFDVELYRKALCTSGSSQITDDNMLLELIGIKIAAVEAEHPNIKITAGEDLLFAELLLRKNGENDD